MQRGQSLNGFQLDNHLFLNDEIEPITAIEFYVAIDDWQGALCFDLQTTRYQFMHQAGFICGLKKAGAKRPVYRDRACNNLSRDFVELPLQLSALCAERRCFCFPATAVLRALCVLCG